VIESNASTSLRQGYGGPPEALAKAEGTEAPKEQGAEGRRRSRLSSMNDRKQINFTIVPDEVGDAARTYANFCAVAHTPFDFTLTFCEVMPLSEREIREAEAEHVVRAPVKARIVMPVQFVPTLIAALQENLRIFSEAHSPQLQPPQASGKGPVH
jgi:hypothetical protein